MYTFVSNCLNLFPEFSVAANSSPFAQRSAYIVGAGSAALFVKRMISLVSLLALAFFVAEPAFASAHPAPSNPFCGYSRERNTVVLDLYCEAGTIDNITFAAYGTPAGCGAPARGSCDDAGFPAYAAATCLGKASCSLSSQDDPCGGVVKAMTVVASCSEAPGGWAPTPPAPKPSCATNGLPCPPPTFAQSWNLTQSSVIQPSSDNYFMPTHPWGLISLDWSVANKIWFKGNTKNTTCEATSRTGCAMLKAAGLAHTCFIYRASSGRAAVCVRPCARSSPAAFLPSPLSPLSPRIF